MALTHKAFLLDAEAFRQKIIPLLTHLDVGSIQPLYEVALEVVGKINPEDWILNDIGSSLLEISIWKQKKGKSKELNVNQSDNVLNILPSDLGYWLLLILSSYLKKCNGIGYNYSILKWSLEKIGCESIWIELLFQGTPISTLAIEHLVSKPNKQDEKDQYLYWMRPSHTKGPGYWLSREQIAKLYDYLITVEDLISHFDYQLFGTRWGPMPITVPDGQKEYYDRLQTAYKQSLLMLKTAQLEKSDLYMVLSYT